MACRAPRLSASGPDSSLVSACSVVRNPSASSARLLSARFTVLSRRIRYVAKASTTRTNARTPTYQSVSLILTDSSMALPVRRSGLSAGDTRGNGSLWRAFRPIRGGTQHVACAAARVKKRDRGARVDLAADAIYIDFEIGRRRVGKEC